ESDELLNQVFGIKLLDGITARELQVLGDKDNGILYDQDGNLRDPAETVIFLEQVIKFEQAYRNSQVQSEINQILRMYKHPETGAALDLSNGLDASDIYILGWYDQDNQEGYGLLYDENGNVRNAGKFIATLEAVSYIQNNFSPKAKNMLGMMINGSLDNLTVESFTKLVNGILFSKDMKDADYDGAQQYWYYNDNEANPAFNNLDRLVSILEKLHDFTTNSEYRQMLYQAYGIYIPYPTELIENEEAMNLLTDLAVNWIGEGIVYEHTRTTLFTNQQLILRKLPDVPTFMQEVKEISKLLRYAEEYPEIATVLNLSQGLYPQQERDGNETERLFNIVSQIGVKEGPFEANKYYTTVDEYIDVLRAAYDILHWFEETTGLPVLVTTLLNESVDLEMLLRSAASVSEPEISPDGRFETAYIYTNEHGQVDDYMSPSYAFTLDNKRGMLLIVRVMSRDGRKVVNPIGMRKISSDETEGKLKDVLLNNTEVEIGKVKEEILNTIEKASVETTVSKTDTKVTIDGRELYVDNQSYQIRGVTIDESFTLKDIPSLVQLGANTVRTYRPLSEKLLGQLSEAGIKVIAGFDYRKDIKTGNYKEYIDTYKDHPAVLMWEFGNEYNYHPEWFTEGIDSWYAVLERAARIAHELDSDHPVSTAHGEFPTPEVLNKCPSVDIWGMNVYRWDNPGNIFSEWQKISDKPMYLSESGADSYDFNADRENQTEQAKANVKIWKQVNENSDICAGITFMSFKDNWSKAGAYDSQDAGGFRNDGVPYDNYANEEYWGFVQKDGTPKKVYFEMRQLWAPETKLTSEQESQLEELQEKLALSSYGEKTEPIRIYDDYSGDLKEIIRVNKREYAEITREKDPVYGEKRLGFKTYSLLGNNIRNYHPDRSRIEVEGWVIGELEYQAQSALVVYMKAYKENEAGTARELTEYQIEIISKNKVAAESFVDGKTLAQTGWRQKAADREKMVVAFGDEEWNLPGTEGEGNLHVFSKVEDMLDIVTEEDAKMRKAKLSKLDNEIGKITKERLTIAGEDEEVTLMEFRLENDEKQISVIHDVLESGKRFIAQQDILSLTTYDEYHHYNYQGTIYEGYTKTDNTLTFEGKIGSSAKYPVTVRDNKGNQEEAILYEVNFNNGEEQISLVYDKLQKGKYITPVQDILASPGSDYPTHDGVIYKDYDYNEEEGVVTFGDKIGTVLIKEEVKTNGKKATLVKVEFKSTDEVQTSLIYDKVEKDKYITPKQKVLYSSDKPGEDATYEYEGDIYGDYEIENGSLNFENKVGEIVEKEEVRINGRKATLVRVRFNTGETQVSLVYDEIAEGRHITPKQKVLYSSDKPGENATYEYNGIVYDNYIVEGGILTFNTKVGTVDTQSVTVDGEKATLVTVDFTDGRSIIRSLVLNEIQEGKFITPIEIRLYPQSERVNNQEITGRAVIQTPASLSEDIAKKNPELKGADSGYPIVYYRYAEGDKVVTLYSRQNKQGELNKLSRKGEFTKDDVLGWSVSLGERTLKLNGKKIRFDLMKEISSPDYTTQRTFGIQGGNKEEIRIKIDESVFEVPRYENGIKIGADTYIVEKISDDNYQTIQKVSISNSFNYKDLDKDISKALKGSKQDISELLPGAKFPELEIWTKIKMLTPEGEVINSSIQAFGNSEEPFINIDEDRLADITVIYNEKKLSLRYDLNSGVDREPVALSYYISETKTLIIDFYKRLAFIEKRDITDKYLTQIWHIRTNGFGFSLFDAERLKKLVTIINSFELTGEELEPGLPEGLVIDRRQSLSYQGENSALLKVFEIPSNVKTYYRLRNEKVHEILISQGRLQEIHWDNLMIESLNRVSVFQDSIGDLSLGEYQYRTWRDFKGNVKIQINYEANGVQKPSLATVVFDFDKYGVGRNSFVLTHTDDGWFMTSRAQMQGREQELFMFEVINGVFGEVSINIDEIDNQYENLEELLERTPSELKGITVLAKNGEGRLKVSRTGYRVRAIDSGYQRVGEPEYIMFAFHNIEVVNAFEAGPLHLGHGSHSYIYGYEAEKGINYDNYENQEWLAHMEFKDISENFRINYNIT
ncbi:MAG: hypothetical protein K9L61_06120, partial [Candidatus Omnitrophica bacterium]|nr:hypothetical protein [Candidatus Omnitrophota bacterium]